MVRDRSPIVQDRPKMAQDSSMEARGRCPRVENLVFSSNRFASTRFTMSWTSFGSDFAPSKMSQDRSKQGPRLVQESQQPAAHGPCTSLQSTVASHQSPVTIPRGRDREASGSGRAAFSAAAKAVSQSTSLFTEVPKRDTIYGIP